MNFELHEYQKKCLEDLRLFFDKAAEMKAGPRGAFLEITDYDHGKYHSAPQMADSMPYVCIRLPTGGGKTLLAAHAVGIAAKRYSETEMPVCLWLAPSNAIVQQTLNALKNRNHPCRIALTEAFAGRDVNCISVSDALRISRADLDSGATVIVATIQSLRQEKTEGRKIYDDNGNLMEHFTSIKPELQDKLRRAPDGAIHQSLDNALQIRRPIIISDEAHNAGTKLSYESLARFNPSCIIEFTATPQTVHDLKNGKYASNVLTQASAFQLKSANMIKFPLNLKVPGDPRETIRAAIEKRNELEKAAKKSGEYIRPIILYQAENKKGETTVEAIEDLLKNDKEFNVKPEEIAVQIGNRKELEKYDLMSPDCSIRHIITVQALAEGWDCPFAYILCTMANFQSPRPVEQILGRIMRLPYASPKKDNALSQCYAYAAKGRFEDVALSLKDTLIKTNGYQKIESDAFVPSPPSDNIGRLFRAGAETPDKPRKFPVPFIVINEKGKQQPLEFEHFLDIQWSIAKEKPQLDDFQFPVFARGKATIDVNKEEQVTITAATEIREDMTYLDSDKNWTRESLVAFLDEGIKHLDIPQAQSVPYILRAINMLCENNKLVELARHRFHVCRYLERKIQELRHQKAKQGYQQILDTVGTTTCKLQVSASHALMLERGKDYQPHSNYEGITSFKNHLHENVGELRDEGEEYECARYLDDLKEIDVWVRNLERRPDHSFWLQTSTDKFYPDFVCRLKDGRVLVVEYKGEDRWSNDDSKEKRDIGKIWAELSGGDCLFIMPKGRNLDEIDALLKKNPKNHRNPTPKNQKRNSKRALA